MKCLAHQVEYCAPCQRTPEQVYAEIVAVQNDRPEHGEPDWDAQVVAHAERVAGLWAELHSAVTLDPAVPRWAAAAALAAFSDAQDHAVTMRRLCGLAPGSGS